MIQIACLHAPVGPIAPSRASNFGQRITRTLTISLGLTTLTACGTTPAQSEDCALLGQQRMRDIEAVMKEAKAINPDLKLTDKGEYPSLKDSEKYLRTQAQIDQIEANFHAKCPERK